MEISKDIQKIMNELTKFNPETLKALTESFKDGLPLPHIKEIFLIETHIAGTSYLDLSSIEPTLEKNGFLKLQREEENPYDNLAILIFEEGGNKLGYIPRSKNEVLSRLMDAGKFIFGRIIDKEWVNSWLKLTIKIYMKDL